MEFLPIFYNIKDQLCLLVGGGDVAYRKASLLVMAGGKLRIVAPELGRDMRQLIKENACEYRAKKYSADDLDGVTLVIAGTDDLQVNIHVSEDARQLGLPTNVVDQPRLSNFIFPAIIDRSPLVIAVSSSGESPVLARLLRARLESLIPGTYGNLAKLVGHFRDQVKTRFSQINQRRAFWESVLQGPIAEMVFAGKSKRAEIMLQKAIDDASAAPDYIGEVYLVGAGPGDPDLLTFRALRLMQQADVVLYDRLVSPQIVDMCRRDAKRINVGKQNKKHTIPQEEINHILVRLAKQGKRVLRLKGGDPFIFGRGGEELDQLMEQGIPFQVVPGITSASGCAAYAGIPLTHRDYAQSVRFLTGHLKNDTCDLPWDELVHKNQTLVIYMGLISINLICQNLINHGMALETPVALVERGTLPEQRVIIGDLATLPALVEKNAIKPPTLVIIGDVVNLHDQLAWFKGTS
jgi:uroporphyrin-III C-methyltransferase/precorrin-2 dehydrogenase/sirohydrochlorin ferrochelatase